MSKPFDSIDEATLERMFDVMKTPCLWQPLFQTRRGIHVIDLSVPDFPAKIAPQRWILILVLQLALKDRASEIHFEPWLFEEESKELGLRMFYKVDDQFLELVPPPTFLTTVLVRDLEAVAGFHSPRRRVARMLRGLASRLDGQPTPPRLGFFRLLVGEDLVDVETTAYPCVDFGGWRIFLRLSSIPDDIWQRISSALIRQFQGYGEQRQAQLSN